MKKIIKEEELEKSIYALKESIDILENNMQKNVSFKRNFFLWILRGIGYTIGATIVASIIIFIIALILSYTKDIPILNDFFNSIGINNALKWTQNLLK